MDVLSLFSGIGGLDLGLQRAGMTIAGQVEIDPWCRRVLAKHWPEVPRHDDVRTCAEWWGDRPVDLICGGFPCQPVSVAGKQLAQADERWLWPAFADTIRRLRPQFVFVENVPGLLVRGMGDVLGDLASLGFDADWDCLSAADFGAPHLRKRIWLVAYTRDWAEPERAWQARREARERAPERREPGVDGSHVADPDGHGARQDAGGSRPAASARPGDGTQWRCEPRPDLGRGPSDVANAAGQGSPDGRSAPGRRPSEARRLEPQRLGRPLADADREPLGWPPITRPERHHWAVEPGVGRVAHGIPRRVDRLHGLGNAVVPQVAEHIGRMIMEAAA